MFSIKMGRRAKIAAAVGAGIIAAGIGAKHYSRVDNPDLVGRQKFWAWNSKSMNVYAGEPGKAKQVGDSKFRLGRTLLRAGYSIYDVRAGGKKVGELKHNFRIAGRTYKLVSTNEVIETLSRTPKMYPARANWRLTRGGKPFLLITETGPSAWLPGIHKFHLIDPQTGKRVGELSAKFEVKRFVIGRRDYAMKLDPEYKGHLTSLEAMGILTAIGKVENISLL